LFQYLQIFTPTFVSFSRFKWAFKNCPRNTVGINTRQNCLSAAPIRNCALHSHNSPCVPPNRNWIRNLILLYHYQETSVPISDYFSYFVATQRNIDSRPYGAHSLWQSNEDPPRWIEQAGGTKIATFTCPTTRRKKGT
jgi:hypothetical protein